VDYFTVRNLVILALVQVGIVGAGVLGAGAAHKWYTELPNIIPVPLPCRLLAEFGWLGLVLPVAWLSVAVWVFARPSATERARVIAVATGFLLVILLLLACWFGAVSPWFRLLGSYD
jgi:hypothetical protein